MTKPPIPTENSKTKGQHTQTPPKIPITQRLRTDTYQYVSNNALCPVSSAQFKMSHRGNDETGQNALCGRCLNNRRTGKDATKPRILGLLGHRS